LDKLGATVFIFDTASGDFQDFYGGYGTGPGTLTLPTDLLISATDTAIVTAGEGDRIEVFVTP
jgi:hypothetical protein